MYSDVMPGKIRVGIVGATVTKGGSGWGANAHVPALHAVPDYEIKAVCTAHADTAKASAQALAEFTIACRHWLPKITVQDDRRKAIAVVAGLVGDRKAEAA